MQENWTADQSKFIEWLATPRYERVPPNQGMLADSMNVDEVTLWRWKKLPGFMDEVNSIVRAGLKLRLGEVYGALLREAERGSYQHIQLVMEMTGEYVKQQKNMNEQSGEVTIVFERKGISTVSE